VTGYAVVYLLLVVNQMLAGGVFLGLYMARSGWWDTPVGRHLAYWVGTTCVVDLSWLLLLVVRWHWLVWLLLAAQLLVGVVGWQRVWLVWRTRHQQG
jgi:hypothetical protein